MIFIQKLPYEPELLTSSKLLSILDAAIIMFSSLNNFATFVFN